MSPARPLVCPRCQDKLRLRCPQCQGTGQQPATCVVCGHPAEYFCDYEGLVYQRVWMQELRVGDKITNSGRDVSGTVCRRTTWYVWMRYRINGELHRERYGTFDGKQVWREQHGTCAAAVCFRHVRELDPNTHLCWEHAEEQTRRITS